MNDGKLLFAQLMDFLPWTSFARSVARYGGDRRVRCLSCAEQFRAMAFAQCKRPKLPSGIVTASVADFCRSNEVSTCFQVDTSSTSV